MAISADESTLFVTCSGPESKVCVVDLKRRKIIETIKAGHSATAPVPDLDGKTLYVCNQFDDSVGVIDLETREEVCRISVQRQPVAADITKDGKYLFVANELPAGRTDQETVAAVVSVIDLAARKVVREIQLPNGSGSLKDIRISPDGKYAAVTHVVSNFNRATTKVQFGWMNANALTIIDVDRMDIAFSLLLDEPNHGAANPWGIAWSADGNILAVAHSGTDEVSLIDFPKLLQGQTMLTNGLVKNKKTVLTYVSHYEGMDAGLPFLTGARTRVKLPEGDLGPRSLVFLGNKLYVANYYSDTLSIMDVEWRGDAIEDAARISYVMEKSIPLGPKRQMDSVRKGDYYFHSGNLCFQGWQSCASCHPDGRADGFNWDLLNDGIGNPKNTRSLLLAYRTSPAMSLGERTNAEAAVRAGLKGILFTNAPEEVAQSIDAYLKSLRPMPSPHLVHGKLSDAAKRGKKLFQSVGCADCHVPPLFTDRKPHDVGTRRPFDGPNDKFYTPTLVEVWRTAPYLHDGSAATMRDVLTARNLNDEHGMTKRLSEQQLEDLCEYVLSL